MPSNIEANENKSAEISSLISNLECSAYGELLASNKIHSFCPGFQSIRLARQCLSSIHNRVNGDADPVHQQGKWR